MEFLFADTFFGEILIGGAELYFNKMKHGFTIGNKINFQMGMTPVTVKYGVAVLQEVIFRKLLASSSPLNMHGHDDLCLARR